jgi:hypothetical protein
VICNFVSPGPSVCFFASLQMLLLLTIELIILEHGHASITSLTFRDHHDRSELEQPLCVEAINPCHFLLRLIVLLVLVSLALGAPSLALGFCLGFLSPSSVKEANVTPEIEDAPEDPQEIADGDLSAIKAGFTEPCKIVRFYPQ